MTAQQQSFAPPKRVQKRKLEMKGTTQAACHHLPFWQPAFTHQGCSFLSGIQAPNISGVSSLPPSFSSSSLQPGFALPYRKPCCSQTSLRPMCACQAQGLLTAQPNTCTFTKGTQATMSEEDKPESRLCPWGCQPL